MSKIQPNILIDPEVERLGELSVSPGPMADYYYSLPVEDKAALDGCTIYVSSFAHAAQTERAADTSQTMYLGPSDEGEQRFLRRHRPVFAAHLFDAANARQLGAPVPADMIVFLGTALYTSALDSIPLALGYVLATHALESSESWRRNDAAERQRLLGDAGPGQRPQPDGQAATRLPSLQRRQAMLVDNLVRGAGDNPPHVLDGALCFAPLNTTRTVQLGLSAPSMRFLAADSTGEYIAHRAQRIRSATI